MTNLVAHNLGEIRVDVAAYSVMLSVEWVAVNE